MTQKTEIDTLTAWTARGLGFAQRALEASARFLEARAKSVGVLAQKLAGESAPAEGTGAAESA